MSTPKYSILLPTLAYYERSQRTVNGLSNIRNLDLEVVIVDDNSPDGTQDAVKSLQKIYGERIVTLNNLQN
jgi:dolichol-phosphate mannosyltransferase